MLNSWTRSVTIHSRPPGTTLVPVPIQGVSRLEPVPRGGARLAAWQGHSYADLLYAAFVSELIKLAGQADIHLIVFPELYLQGYLSLASDAILQSDGGALAKVLGMIGAAAGSAQVAVAMGYAERMGPEDQYNIYNSMKVWHADGTVASNYRKVCLYGDSEKRLFQQGSKDQWGRAFQLRLKTCEVRCGVCICYDIENSEAPRLLAKDGAEMLLVSAAAGTTGVTLGQDQDPPIPGTNIDFIAKLYGLVVIRANVPIIPEAPTKYCGQSTVCGKSGVVKHPLIPDDDHLVIKSEVFTRGGQGPLELGSEEHRALFDAVAAPPPSGSAAGSNSKAVYGCTLGHAKFCGVTCQKEGWATHRQECKANASVIKKAAAAGSPTVKIVTWEALEELEGQQATDSILEVRIMSVPMPPFMRSTVEAKDRKGGVGTIAFYSTSP
eukprot:CAMPEP_0181354420 /NCGR_PEP_ID=MMETSP1106-20121128/3351_1 /TAXON_ID=81844 /ORGANISM="Mantoniella antarctica, Strain SL-175" /LENGTH=436 /DNA_ID=CAMNT_0023467081 /DNA_START=201 /DNA_END=1510 /DNA_ORIENTATION=-